MPLSNKVTSATITLYKINETSIYNAELVSSNGVIFHPYDINTDLIFKVYKNSKDITSEFEDIVWSRISYDKNSLIDDRQWGEQYRGLNIIHITKDDFQEKCIIQADAYDIIDKKRTCVASARITLLDVNELHSGSTPPENPVDGQIWVDTGGETPMIYSWNDVTKQWTIVGKTTPTVRNLIRNSNFWTLNDEYYFIENDMYLLNTTVNQAFNKNWLRIKSNKKTDNENMTAGIYQVTDFPIVKDSYYTFSFLSYCVNDIEYDSILNYVKIISFDESGESTELISSVSAMSNKQYERTNYTFKTLRNTENIKIMIGVAPKNMCEFYITELSLYNTDKIYPWELAPEDVQLQLERKLNNDHESVFNAFTKNGTMEGIYVDIDEDGNEHFYFNGSHIKVGSIDGGLINGIGLNIRDDVTGKSIFRVYKDEFGTHIDMTANNLYIGTEPASTQKYADDQAAEAEANAAGYTNTTVAVNRAESEELLNNNIAVSAQTVTTNMTNYVDTKIEEAVDSNNNYTDNSILGSTNNLTKVINSKTEAAEKNANAYTDNKISALTKTINETLQSMDGDITDIQTNVLAESKEYTDTITDVIIKDLSDHKTNMDNYLTQQFSVINNRVNTKADASAVDGLTTRVSTLETNTKISNIVSSVLASKEYKDSLDTKVDKTEFATYKTTMEGELTTINNKLSNVHGTSNEPIENIYSKEFLCNKNITFTQGSTETTTLNNLLDLINITTNGTNIALDVSKIINTNFITVSDNNSNVYLNLQEVIKFLIYKIKELENRL